MEIWKSLGNLERFFSTGMGKEARDMGMDYSAMGSKNVEITAIAMFCKKTFCKTEMVI